MPSKEGYNPSPEVLEKVNKTLALMAEGKSQKAALEEVGLNGATFWAARKSLGLPMRKRSPNENYKGVSEEETTPQKLKRVKRMMRTGVSLTKALETVGMSKSTYYDNVGTERPEPTLSTIIAAPDVPETTTQKTNNDLFAVFFIRPDQIKQILGQL